MDDSIEEILVDDINVFEKCKEFLDLTMPHQSQKLKLYEENTPLFSKLEELVILCSQVLQALEGILIV